jgi:hypothetical protein
MATIVRRARKFRASNQDGNLELVDPEQCKTVQLKKDPSTFGGVFLHRTRTGRWFLETYDPPLRDKNQKTGKELTIGEVRQWLEDHDVPGDVARLLHRDNEQARSKSRRDSRPTAESPLTQEVLELSSDYRKLVSKLGRSLSPKELKILGAVQPSEPLDGRNIAFVADVSYDSSLRGILKKVLDLGLVRKTKGKGGYLLSRAGQEALNRAAAQ